MASGAAALGWQMLQVASYFPGWPVTVPGADRCEPGKQIRLLNINVLQPNRDFAGVIRLIEEHDPDLVLLLETDSAWVQALRPVRERFPHQVVRPLPNTYGLILLSKLPLEGAQIRYLLQPHVPSVRAAIKLASGELVDFYGVHPEPPLPGDDSGERDAELVMVGREVRAGGRAAIVMGDLNDVAWSDTSRLFRRLSGTNDARVGRGPYPTYPADLWLVSWPLDHLFLTPHFTLLGIDRLPDVGSDHRPMLFDLCLARDPNARFVRPTPPADVQEDARDQISDGAEERAEESVD